MDLTNRLTNQTIGRNTTSRGASGRLAGMAIFSGNVAPMILGVISANTRIRKVMARSGREQRPVVVADQPDRHRRDQGRRCGIDEVVAQQNRAEQPIGMVEQGLHAAGRAMALAHDVAQPQAIQRHERCLGDREERRDQEQNYEPDERDPEG